LRAFWINSDGHHSERIRNTKFIKENDVITKIEKVVYTAKAHSTGGREGGSSRTSDGRLDVKLSVPGTPGNGTNPEQLFAVGWSSCYLSAIKIVAARMKVRLPADFAVDAEVDLGTAGAAYFIQARLNVKLPGIDSAVAQALVDGAHQECPYSKATHGNINVVTDVETKPAAHIA
jgi:Ohr subfamily peroxiredoxin